MIRICSKCGALLLDDTESCSFCEVPAVEKGELPETVAVGTAGSNEPVEPEWRVEVSRRLEQYRARRGRLRPDDPQSGLPFHESSAASEFGTEQREHRRFRPIQRQRPAERRTERVEICIQPELDFATAAEERARPQTALVPVATLARRRWAGALDALFLGLTLAGFLGLFRSLGGQITLAKMDAIVYLAVAYLFYALYFFIFTTLAGATPGMQLCGLNVVRLDGSLPDTRQLLWRNFGYLLSGATLLLGFLWAIWDEDHFTWQDRISQTYVTAAAPLSDIDSFDLPRRQHTFAHK
ncbi:MAG TPA: RDD family protein [Candidatus Acidoferrales bacterium]|nr:RDD family protein [Candidatus Acidoferrales bacterium]